MVYSLSYFIVLSSNAILKIKRIFIKEKFAGLGILRSSKIESELYPLFTLQSDKFITCRDVSCITQQLLCSANSSGSSTAVTVTELVLPQQLDCQIILIRTLPEILRRAASQISWAQ